MTVLLQKRSTPVVIVPIMAASVVLFCLIFWLIWRLYPKNRRQFDEKSTRRMSLRNFQIPCHYRTLDPWARGSPGPRSVGQFDSTDTIPPPYVAEKLPPYPRPVYLV